MRTLPFAWVGLIILVAPVSAYFLDNPQEHEIENFWRPVNHIWPTFAGVLLILWATFQAWDEQTQPASPASLDSLRAEIAELRLQLDARKRRYLTSNQRAATYSVAKGF